MNRAQNQEPHGNRTGRKIFIMITLVIGGSCSGKSEYAERCLDFAAGEKIYIATMIAADEESKERVRRHRERRCGRGFRTVECPNGLDLIAEGLPRGCSVLLEGIGTLAANELFSGYTSGNDAQVLMAGDGRLRDVSGGSGENFQAARQRILAGIRQLAAKSEEFVIVSDEVNRAGCDYEGDTRAYQRLIGELNQELCKFADRVVEMVCGCAVVRKGA